MATTTTPSVKPGPGAPLAVRHALASQAQHVEDATPKPPSRKRAGAAAAAAKVAKPTGGATAAQRDASKAATAARRQATRERDQQIVERYVRMLADGVTSDTVAKVGQTFKPVLTFGVCNTVLYVWKRDLKAAGKPVPGPRNVPAAVAMVKMIDRQAAKAAQPKASPKPRAPRAVKGAAAPVTPQPEEAPAS